MNRIWVALCFVFALWSGSALANGVPPQPSVTSVMGAPIDFGDVAVGSSSEITISGTNNTGHTVLIFGAFAGQDGQDFSVVNHCMGTKVVPGAMCSGTLSFHPTSPGPKSVLLIIVSRSVDVAVLQADPGRMFPKIALDPGFIYTTMVAVTGNGI